MPRRIDIELTSALGDGNWTWRAAGAKQPRGVLDGTILPTGSKVGDELKVEIEQEIDGITVLGVVHGREKAAREDVIELLPIEREFQPVVETRARRERGERRPRRDGDRRPRRDGEGQERRGDRGRAGRDDRSRDDRNRDGRGRDDRGGERRGEGRRDRRGPAFTPPPEVPQRPKPKRLKPGKAHRTAVLSELPEEQRAVAELALQGMSAVRSRLKEENKKAAAEGRPTMPEATVLKLAEELLPRLRVAEWRDRAEAAQRQLEHLDLRDLRSVVAAANDPMVARDESTRALAGELQTALASKQEQELLLWFGDVDAALAVGRVIRALRLSSQPPKAGVPFPTDIAQRLLDSTNAALAPMDGPERWSAILEAAAFSPIRTMVQPTRRPDAVNDELMATIRRLAPALPRVAELFEIEVAPDAPMPKPQRPGPRQRKDKTEAPPGRRPRAAGDERGRSTPPIPPPPTTDPAARPAPAADAAPERSEQADTAQDVTETTAPAEPETTEPDTAQDDTDAAAPEEPETTAQPAEPDTAQDDAPSEPEPVASTDTAESTGDDAADQAAADGVAEADDEEATGS